MHPEVASEHVWSESERMRDVGSQICVPILVKPSLDTSVVFVLLPIYLFRFAARASVNPSVGTLSGTCEQMQPSCTHSHKGTWQNLFLSPSFTSDFRGHLLRETFDQNCAPAPCSLERREKMSCLVHVLLTLLSPAL